MLPLISENLNSETVSTCNAKDLHVALEIDKDFSGWVKDLIEDYKLIENEDYIVSEGDHHLTLDTAKLFAMTSNTETGRKVRQYFIACEKDMKALLLERTKLAEQGLETAERAQSLNLDAQLAIRHINEEYDLAQEFVTAYLAECKELKIKPTSVLTKQRAYIKESVKLRKARAKQLQELVDDGIINGKPLETIRKDIESTALAYNKKPLKNLTLSGRDLMRLA